MTQPARSATLPKLRQAIKHSGQDPDCHKSLNVTGTGGKADTCGGEVDLDLGGYCGFVTARRQPKESLDARLQQKKLKDELISDSEIEYLIKEKLRKEQYAVECLFRNADPSRCGRVHRNALLRILYSICGHVRFDQFHRLLDRLGLDDTQTVSFADFKASFSGDPESRQEAAASRDCESAAATAGPMIGRYSTKPVSVAHAFTMLRQRAAVPEFDPRQVLPAACFEPGGVVLKPQLLQAVGLLRIPLAASDLDKLWDRFDIQGTGAVGTNLLLTMLGGCSQAAPPTDRKRPAARSKTAPPRKPNQPVATVEAEPAAAGAEKSSSAAEDAPKPASAQRCQTADAAGTGDLQYLRRYDKLRKNRPKFDHFLDDLHYRFDEPYNAVLVTCRHFNPSESGSVPADSLRRVLSGFGLPTATDADFDQFLIRFGLRPSGGSQGSVSYADLLGRLHARGSNSLLAQYLTSDTSPLLSEDPQASAGVAFCSLSPYQMELRLLRFLHRDFLQMHSGFMREDSQKSGVITEEAFRRVLGRLLKLAELPSEQVTEVLARLPRSHAGGVQYKPFLELFHIAPNAWSKQSLRCVPVLIALPAGLVASAERVCTLRLPPAVEPGAAEAEQQPSAGGKPSGAKSQQVRSVLELSQLAQVALSAHFHQVDKLYKQMDRRNTGRMTRKQFWILLNSLGLQLSEPEMQTLWATLDTSADGQWSYRQMLRHFMTNLHERALEKLRAGRNWQRHDTLDPSVLRLRQIKLDAAESKLLNQSDKPQQLQPLLSAIGTHNAAPTRQQLAALIDKCRKQLVENWDDVKLRLRRLDPQGTSCIQRVEFKELARELQLPLTSDEMNSLARSFEKNGNGRINYIAFLKSFVSQSAAPLSRTEELAKTVTDNKQGNRIRIAQIMDRIREKLLFEWQSLLLAFRKLDAEKSGHLSIFELRRIVQQSGYSLSEDDLFLLLSEFDLDFDGKINYQEFVVQLLDVAKTA